jgi:hydroxymethylglutaryl-CoA lyase
MKIIECPRDAMQGLPDFIPTPLKLQYLQQLLAVGFDTIDFGSFVSPTAIPQLRDTAAVLAGLDLSTTRSKLLAIVANTRGATEAASFEQIHYLGFPLSISETFQRRNTNKTIAEALQTLDEIQDICKKNNKTLVTYISMGFGNPYGDPYDTTRVVEFVELLMARGITIISLADTVGVADAAAVRTLFQSLAREYPSIELGAHLHATPATAMTKIAAAFEAGCKRFDGAIRGYGGCPMANDDLVGNLPTETIVAYLQTQGVVFDLDRNAFERSLKLADEIFPKH